MSDGCITLADYLTGIGTGFLGGVTLTIAALLSGFAMHDRKHKEAEK